MDLVTDLTLVLVAALGGGFLAQSPTHERC